MAALAALVLAAPAVAETRVFLVPTATLYPGDPVATEMLTEKSFTGSAKVLAGYVEQVHEVGGKFARRTLVAGKPIPLVAIRSAEVVFEGQPVEASYVSDGLSITTTLVPLESASAGDTVKARNPDSGLTVSAVAQADGTLRVEAP